jgi:hypothetical protein
LGGRPVLPGGSGKYGPLVILFWGENNRQPEHDPDKWMPVFPRDKRGTRLRGDHAQTGSYGAMTIYPEFIVL